MSVPLLNSFLAIPIAMLLPYVPHLLKAVEANSVLPKGYDLRDPRRSVQLAIQGDSNSAKFISRAQGAHLNGLESWPQFAVAVLMAHIAGISANEQDACATIYILARIAYTYVYCHNTTGKRALLRSTLWFAGMIPTFYLAFKAGWIMSFAHRK